MRLSLLLAVMAILVGCQDDYDYNYDDSFSNGRRDYNDERAFSYGRRKHHFGDYEMQKFEVIFDIIH